MDKGRPGNDNNSIVTLYDNAVMVRTANESEPGKKRDSSSSEEPLDTSDEIDKLTTDQADLNLGNEQVPTNQHLNIVQFISHVRRQQAIRLEETKKPKTTVHSDAGNGESEQVPRWT